MFFVISGFMLAIALGLPNYDTLSSVIKSQEKTITSELAIYVGTYKMPLLVAQFLAKNDDYDIDDLTNVSLPCCFPYLLLLHM
ncbi:hypothetical protein [Photobacterium leiognathi]|uniref:hypothetical protein n=1 Tax=Photobacterium leiognathi TaxID=553611 RepID=UPI0029816755|nr:hypothetical protein [Photobacterium leiognathi]